MSKLEFLVNTLQQAHKGDEDILETLLLSAVSAHPTFDIKLNVSLTGMSDVGKTGAGMSVLGIMPKEYQYETHKVSPKVLYYQAMEGYTFNNKTIFLDDVIENDSEVLKNIANTSNRPPSFTTLVNQKPCQINFDYAPVVWTTRVDLLEDYQGQADRRFYTVEVKGSKDTIKHIVEMESNNIKPEKSESWQEAKTIMKNVMGQSVEVIIPKFDYSFIQTNSGVKYLISMIRSVAKINATDYTELIVVASEEDIAEATRLYKSNSVQQYKLKESAVKLLDYIPRIKPTESDFTDSDNSPNTVEAIFENAKNLGIKIDVVRKSLKSLENKGIVNSIQGRYNRQFYYKL